MKVQYEKDGNIIEVDAWREGFKAAANEQSTETNPYTFRSTAYHEWRKGWFECAWYLADKGD